jgi:hypothetical protein
MTCADRCSVKFPNIEIYDIRPRVVLFLVDRQKDGRTDRQDEAHNRFSRCFANAPKTVPNRELGYTQLIVYTIGAVDSRAIKNTVCGQNAVCRPSLCVTFRESLTMIQCGQAQCLRIFLIFKILYLTQLKTQ